MDKWKLLLWWFTVKYAALRLWAWLTIPAGGIIETETEGWLSIRYLALMLRVKTTFISRDIVRACHPDFTVGEDYTVEFVRGKPTMAFSVEGAMNVCSLVGTPAAEGFFVTLKDYAESRRHEVPDILSEERLHFMQNRFHLHRSP